MTETPTTPVTPALPDISGYLPGDEVFSAIRTFQRICYQNAEDKGFHKAAHDIQEYAVSVGGIERGDVKTRIQDRFGNRLMLIVGEAIEAHDEVRAGRMPGEEWVNVTPGKEGKPEGVPSELADIVIRVMDLAGEHGIDIADVIRRKMAYNATREAMHGVQF